MTRASNNFLPHLNSTIEALRGGLVEAKAGATRSINSWAETLGNSGDEQLTAIAEELQNLKAALSGDGLDSGPLQESLRKLGQQTTQAAAGADGATADKVRQIGELLSQAAEQLK
jgi:hypothetical protein